MSKSDRERWKRAERRIAEILGGERVPITGRHSGDVSDVKHDLFSIEVKTKKRHYQGLVQAMEQAVKASKRENTLPLVVVHESGRQHRSDHVIMRMGDFVALLCGLDPNIHDDVYGWLAKVQRQEREWG